MSKLVLALVLRGLTGSLTPVRQCSVWLWIPFLVLTLVPTLAPGAERRGPLLGLGAYFLEPGERTAASGRPAQAAARGMVSARHSMALSDAFSFEPHLGLLMPSRTKEGAWLWAALLDADLGYALLPSFLVLAGTGVHAEMLVSQARNVSLSGDFVTPAGAQMMWVFTSNLGLAYRLDSRLRLDGGLRVQRVLSAGARKLRFFVEVNYAL